MQAEFEHDIFRLYWHDTESRILIINVFSHWTWQDALELLQVGERLFSPNQYPRYSIIHFKDGIAKLPDTNHDAIDNLRKIVALDKGNERIICLVGRQVHALKAILRTASAVYNLIGQTSKYRYARNFDDALAIITQDQAETEA